MGDQVNKQTITRDKNMSTSVMLLIKLVGIKIRELLEEMGFSEENTPIVKGSALCALEDTKPELGLEAINQLMEVVDQTIPDRDLDLPFLMPVDHMHNI